MAEWIPCRVCRAPKAKGELDSTGRCLGCRLAKEATDAGMHYGAYMGAMHERETDRALAAMREEQRARAEDEKRKKQEQDELEAGWRRICPVCGKSFSYSRGSKVFCSAQCRSAHNYRQEREKIVQKRKCVICGKKLDDIRKSYCSQYCKYEAERIRRRSSKG